MTFYPRRLAQKVTDLHTFRQNFKQLE